MLQMNETTHAARGAERCCHADKVAARCRRLVATPRVRDQLLDRIALETKGCSTSAT